ncbi:TIGR02391 family protein [Mycobacteroides abscessus]
MKPDDAIARLEQLATEGRTAGQRENGFWANAWVARVRDVVARSLGPEHDLVRKLDGHLHRQAVGKVNAAGALIDSAIYCLEIAKDEPQPVDPASFDSELWDHVSGLVSTGDWGKIPSAAATFTEHKVRIWSESGTDSFGKGLYGNAFADAGPLRLGASKAEWEGWRSLAIGFAQAVSNVDRHRIQDRADLRQYAIGALGTASLLLVQIRREHPDTIARAESA